MVTFDRAGHSIEHRHFGRCCRLVFMRGEKAMSYLGSKEASGVYQKIIAEMPPYDTYIETYLGGGVVMLRKPWLGYLDG